MLIVSLIEYFPIASGTESRTHLLKVVLTQKLVLWQVPTALQHKGFLLAESLQVGQTLRQFSLCFAVWEGGEGDNHLVEQQNLALARPLDEHG